MAAEQDPGLPKDTKGLLEYASAAYKDHKGVVLALGAVAAALGAGIYTYRKGRDDPEEQSIFIGYGDRRKEKKGVLSIGERREHGAAVSVPTTTDLSTEDSDIFALHDGEIIRPGANVNDTTEYTDTARHMLGALRDYLLDQFRQTPGE